MQPVHLVSMIGSGKSNLAQVELMQVKESLYTINLLCSVQQLFYGFGIAKICLKKY